MFPISFEPPAIASISSFQNLIFLLLSAPREENGTSKASEAQSAGLVVRRDLYDDSGALLVRCHL